MWLGGLGHEFHDQDLGGRRITGGSYPARIWGNFMNAWQQGRPAVAFPARPAAPVARRSTVPGGVDLSPPPAPPPQPPPPGPPQPGTPPPATPPPPARPAQGFQGGDGRGGDGNGGGDGGGGPD